MARFNTLYSGSSGNCAVLEEDGRFLLVDVGCNCKTTLLALDALGLSLQGLCGVLVTHEHIDHVRGLEVLLKRHSVPLCATAPTLDALWRAALIPECADMVEAELGEVDVGGFRVRAFPTSHDAAGPCGWRITTPGGSIMAIATDLGKMTADVFIQFESAALVALEANYDPDMLRFGPYPAALKRRIASPQGHLSNPDSARAVTQLIMAGCRSVALCHLSEENNRPEKVQAAIQAALFEAGLRLPEGCTIQVAPRHTPGSWMHF